MKVETLTGSDSVKVTVRLDNISLKDSSSLSKKFRKISKDNNLFVSSPTHLDHLEYTDLYFRVSEQPDNWQRTFMEALQKAVDEKGWKMQDNDNDLTMVYSI